MESFLDDNSLLLSVVVFIWLTFVWETFLTMRQVNLSQPVICNETRYKFLTFEENISRPIA